MTGSSRRIFLYWLLLLLPTLAVGAGALVLLQREQARVAERSADALEARRANTAARARLTVETIELLVGDVQNGLLDTLAAEPGEGLDTFLDRWEKENPLVRTAFRLTPDGSVVRPDARTANEDGRAFLRRFSRQLGPQPPWTTASSAPAKVVIDETKKRQQIDVAAGKDSSLAVAPMQAARRDGFEGGKALSESQAPPVAEPEVRKEIAFNVAQVQQARRDVQELVKVPSYSNNMVANVSQGSSNTLAPPSTEKESNSRATSSTADTFAEKKAEQVNSRARPSSFSSVSQGQQARRDVQPLLKAPDYSNSANTIAAAAQAAPAVQQRKFEATQPGAPTLDEKAAKADSLLFTSRLDGSAGSKAAEAKAVVVTEVEKAKDEALASPLRAKDVMPDRRGWVPVNVDGRMRLTGWVQLGGLGEVRGFELNLAELVSRFGSALPAGVGAGEGYALRDEQGRVLHVVGAVSSGMAPVSRIPLAASLLPGWEVVGYLSGGIAQSEGTTNFVWVSTLLVGLFLVAILTGGSLLLWQARRSDAEAAQKTSFVANVSHEFKTPLTTIRLYAELLEQGRVRDATQGGDYLRTIGRETQRLARLVNNALDFSRLEQGQKKFARESLDLAAELAHLLDTHAPRVTEAGLTLQRDLPAAALNVVTDRDAVAQIVLNLLDNACKYAEGGGEVLVTLAPRTGGGAEVHVADRGPGVPPEHRERIFEKFHRVDDALTAEKSGAGLGLSIARQLARGLGGELRYTPRAGGGAEFILELP